MRQAIRKMPQMEKIASFKLLGPVQQNFKVKVCRSHQTHQYPIKLVNSNKIHVFSEKTQLIRRLVVVASPAGSYVPPLHGFKKKKRSGRIITTVIIISNF